jgi:hypothetical protein
VYAVVKATTNGAGQHVFQGSSEHVLVYVCSLDILAYIKARDIEPSFS